MAILFHLGLQWWLSSLAIINSYTWSVLLQTGVDINSNWTPSATDHVPFTSLNNHASSHQIWCVSIFSVTKYQALLDIAICPSGSVVWALLPLLSSSTLTRASVVFAGLECTTAYEPFPPSSHNCHTIIVCGTAGNGSEYSDGYPVALQHAIVSVVLRESKIMPLVVICVSSKAIQSIVSGSWSQVLKDLSIAKYMLVAAGSLWRLVSHDAFASTQLASLSELIAYNTPGSAEKSGTKSTNVPW